MKLPKNNCTKCKHGEDRVDYNFNETDLVCEKYGFFFKKYLALRTTCKSFKEKEKE